MSAVHKPEILASSNQHSTFQGVNKDAKKKFAFWCAKAKSPDCIEASLGKSKTKAELLQVGIFFPHPFICMRNFITKKVGNRRN